MIISLSLKAINFFEMLGDVNPPSIFLIFTENVALLQISHVSRINRSAMTGFGPIFI